MGFDISGIALGNNFERDIAKVSQDLELGIEVIEEVKAYEASMKIEEKDTVLICFTESATLVFYESSLYDHKIYSQTTDSINFQYYEVPMIFAFRVVRDCEQVRNYLSIDGEEKLSIRREVRGEAGVKRADEKVLKLVKQISDINILRIPDTIKVLKCKLAEYKGERTRRSEKEIQAMLTHRRISGTHSHDYDVFKF